MITISKKLRIMRKPKVSEFLTANFKVLGDIGSKKIGGSINAEAAMLVNSEELASYVPLLIGISPTSPDWGKALDNYVRSLSVIIEDNGKEIEIGFVFDITDITKKEAINVYRKENNLEDASEEDLVAHICANVNRNYFWKYGRPIEAKDYYLWRYCQNYRAVANTLKDVDDTSLSIRFYILDEEELAKDQQSAFKLKNAANKMYFEILNKPEDVRAVLFLMDKGDKVLTAKDNEALMMILDQAKDENVGVFMKAAKNLDKRRDEVFIEECVARAILQKAPHSNMIVDSADGTVIGANVKEAAAFLNLPANLKIKNTLEGVLKNKSL